MKNFLVLLSMTILRLDSLFIFGALHLLEIQRQQKKLYYVLYVDIRRKENKEKTKNISQK